MSINLRVPKTETELKPRITVVGVGGAGGNAVNNMIRSNLQGVEFVCANTDAQALTQNLAERKIQLGVNINRGLGAGAKPEVGKSAAEESIEEIMEHIQGSNMCFITAGMGGGTGSGAGPVIARASRELGILTVGVVTKPFTFEGAHRMRLAENAIEDMQNYVDTLIVIPNQNLFRIANERTTFADAFKMADDVLYSGVRGVTDLITMPGLINLDFADIQTVMAEMGKAMMGTGEAEGDRRALDAAEAAINNPLLDDVSMKGARAVLINITGGLDMTLFEVDEAANRIRSEVDGDANIIFGAFFDEKLAGRMRISIVAAGMDAALIKSNNNQNANSPFGLNLRPQKILPHADVIASARKPMPQNINTPSASVQPLSMQSSQPQNTGFYTSNKADAPRPEFKPDFEPMTFARSTPSSESTNNASSETFVAPKPAEVPSSMESITLTDRIVSGRTTAQPAPAAPASSFTDNDDIAASVQVDLRQSRPVEKAMQRTPVHQTATSPSNPDSSGAAAYTPPSSRPSVSGNTTNYSAAPTAAAERTTESASSRADRTQQRRGPGLFERMMGGVMGSKTDEPNLSSSRQEPTLLKTETPTNTSSAKPKDDMLSSAKPADNDDLLDIPAFLRRGQ